jgi:hypothetical protein
MIVPKLLMELVLLMPLVLQPTLVSAVTVTLDGLEPDLSVMMLTSVLRRPTTARQKQHALIPSEASHVLVTKDIPEPELFALLETIVPMVISPTELVPRMPLVLHSTLELTVHVTPDGLEPDLSVPISMSVLKRSTTVLLKRRVPIPLEASHALATMDISETVPLALLETIVPMVTPLTENATLMLLVLLSSLELTAHATLVTLEPE